MYTIPNTDQTWLNNVHHISKVLGIHYQQITLKTFSITHVVVSQIP